jgi:hypothetical protein
LCRSKIAFIIVVREEGDGQRKEKDETRSVLARHNVNGILKREREERERKWQPRYPRDCTRS